MMNRVLPFIRLVRPVNLIMILFTQYMIRFAFLYPVFRVTHFSLQVPEGVFFLFSMAFVCMAAGGYIINDYNDVEMDKINKPGKVIIGNGVSPKQATAMYWVFSITGIIIGCWGAYKADLPGLGMLFFVYLSGLWYYSTSLKYVMLAGNVLISLFLALVPFTAGLIELYADVRNPLFIGSDINFSFLLYGVTAVALFAFLINLAREIIKDTEDMEGDKASGCRTLPIIAGIRASKIAVVFTLLIIFFLLCYLAHQCIETSDWLSLAYITVFIQLPIIVLIWRVNKASAQADYHKISTWLKMLMVSGISYLFLFAYVSLH